METTFRVGPWTVEPLRHRLGREGDERRITPKTMDLLVRLAERPGEVVTRDELLAAVWPDTHASEEVLTRVVSDLRAALGDDRRNPGYVETIPKVGYRLVAPVVRESPCDPGEPGATGETDPHRTAAPRLARLSLAALSIAVVALAVTLIGLRARPATPPAPAAPAPLPIRPLTALPGFESHAEISPDGTRVVFTRSGDDLDGVDLWIVDVEGGEPRRLTDDPGTDVGATWTPDGRRVVFGRYADRTCTVLELPVEGGPERRIGSCGANVAADFDVSPDGEWLAYSDRESSDASYGIWLTSLVDGARRELVAPEGQAWGDHSPSFSPDGREVAFTRSVSMATQDVWRIAIAGGEPRPVTRDGRSIRGHAWRPDGRSLIVSSRRTGWRGLWEFPLDGGDPSWLPLQVFHAWRPSLAAAGPLLFERRVLEVGLTTVRTDGGLPRPWTESRSEDLDPRWSPDGSRVAFTSNRSGFFEIWTADADGGDARQVTSLGGSYCGNAEWSPRGDRIVFDARVDGQADVWLLDLADGRPRRLTHDRANDLGPVFVDGGRAVLFGSNRADGRWQIWRTALDGGVPERVTDDGGYLARLSADGRTLYYTKYGREPIFRRPFDGGEESIVPGTETLVDHENWTVVGDDLYLIARESEGSLRLVRVRGDRPEGVRELDGARPMAGLAVHPGGTTVMYATITRLEADLWRVDE